MSGRKVKYNIYDIKKDFESKGAHLISTEYPGCKKPLYFNCAKCGSEYSILYRNYLLGRNSNLLCKNCQKSVTVSDIDKEFAVRGSKLLSESFENVNKNLLVTCSLCGKEISISWSNYKAGHNNRLLCKSCRSNLSGNIKLDVMHTENDGNSLYAKKLTEYSKGILYIPIYPYEKNLPVLKSMLDNRNNLSTRIYARNCKASLIFDGKQFLKENHIQGYRKATITIGLFYGDTLVSVMSFDKSRFNKNYEYELIRLATLSNYVVVGGASKMFKYFVDNFNPDSIISYCDIRFCKPVPEETVYSKLGFIYLHKSMSNYRYFSSDMKKSYSRMACQKHRLKDLLKSFDPTKTEYQNMKDNGFIRIYDCGNYVFGWKN